MHWRKVQFVVLAVLVGMLSGWASLTGWELLGFPVAIGLLSSGLLHGGDEGER